MLSRRESVDWIVQTQSLPRNPLRTSNSHRPAGKPAVCGTLSITVEFFAMRRLSSVRAADCQGSVAGSGAVGAGVGAMPSAGVVA
jgi:hypothetical protein